MTSLAPKWFPEKIRDWLTWPKADGGGQSSPPETIPPYSPKNPPSSRGPQPGGGRRPVSEKPKPGTAEDVGASLEALHAAEDALRAERAAQAKRVAALARCERGVLETRAQDIADIERAIDDAVKRFEELQQQLKEEVGKQLNQIAQFNDDYNKAWNQGMDGLDKYLHTYPQLMSGLKKLFDIVVDRNTALEMGHAIDEKIHQAIGAVMAVQGAAGLVRGVAKWVAEEGALEATEGAAGLAAKKGLSGLEGEVEAVASKGAQRGVIEGTGEAAGKQVATESAEAASTRAAGNEAVAVGASSEQTLTLEEYKALLARQQAGEMLDLSKIPRPAIGNVNPETGRIAVLQGTGRYANLPADGALDIFVPKGTPLPNGAQLVQSGVSSEVVETANLLSSRGAAGSNPVFVKAAAKLADTFDHIRVPKSLLDAPLMRPG